MDVKREYNLKLDDELKENIYLNHCIINIDEVKKIEDELLEEEIYLPALLRGMISKKYLQRIKEKGLYEEILPDLVKAYKYTREDSCIEFINWIDTHKKYKNLLNEKELKVLGDELEELELMSW